MLGLDGYKSGSSDGEAAVAGNLFAKDLTTVGSDLLKKHNQGQGKQQAYAG